MCRRSPWIALWLALAVAALPACSPKLSYQAMAQQPRYEAYEGGPDLPNAQSARVPPPGTVARGDLRDDALLTTGLTPEGNPSDLFPFEVTLELLERGQAQYNAYCTPCHDYAGMGEGRTVQFGFPQPPSLHEPRLRDMPVGQIFRVITFGQGAMPAYAEQVDVRDRWAIVAYVRALQLSQNASRDDVPPEAAGQLAEEGAP